ncbi:zona pellucida sperm-binding protein 3-like [Electrophorus electricus]|uniref:zona pellucida sperm-binding protein 3-like n=1 Tax=Electrophorus electricus TaxID=8005 RepID=UPI0015D06221|nr:zona pellucida sperm-binding protein 3-like [Electrophorus electricus]
MVLCEVGFMLLLLVAFGSTLAQWQGMNKIQVPSGLQFKHPVQAGQQTVTGVSSQGSHTSKPTGPAQASLGQQSRNPVQIPVQQHFNLQSQQELQGPVKQVTWHFPQEPQLPARQPPVQFEMPQPAAAESIAAECGENEVYVEVKRDLFGTGELINPADLTLGGCAVTGEDSAAQVLIFQLALQACNSTTIMTQDELVYVFLLRYVPVTLAHTPVVRTVGAVTHIECHYPRRHNVSSNALMPAWIPYASTQVAEEQLVFSLRLMADDWQSERVSNQYFLNDVINVEASVIQFYHVPLRVYVDSCVATVVPDVNAVPRYAFIEEYGCLIDAKLTGSQSHFLPQTEADRLRFHLEAFKFQQDNSGLIYFTCFMKATAASLPADAEHKACSFSGNRWTAAYGDNRVCGCCDTTCGFWEGRDLSVDRGTQLEGDVTLGPIMVKE